MFKRLSRFISYYLETFRYRSVRFSIVEVMIKNNQIFILYRINGPRISSTQSLLVSNIEDKRDYFNQYDRLKIDACMLVDEVFQSVYMLSCDSELKQKLLGEVSKRISRYLGARYEQ